MSTEHKVRNISNLDIPHILSINEFANINRKNPKQWVNGFNTYKLDSNILLRLIQEYDSSQEEIFLVCADSSGIVVGYLIAFYINANNVALHNDKLSIVFNKSIKETILLEIDNNKIMTISHGFEEFWKNLESQRNTLSYTYGLQIAIHPNYKRKGLGRLLINGLFHESVVRGSKFFICDVEIFPSFNLAQFEFLFKKMDLKISSIISTQFNPNEEERCALFYKEF
jgi:hypothetical protein